MVRHQRQSMAATDTRRPMYWPPVMRGRRGCARISRANREPLSSTGRGEGDLDSLLSPDAFSFLCVDQQLYLRFLYTSVVVFTAAAHSKSHSKRTSFPGWGARRGSANTTRLDANCLRHEWTRPTPTDCKWPTPSLRAFLHIASHLQTSLPHSTFPHRTSALRLVNSGPLCEFMLTFICTAT